MHTFPSVLEGISDLSLEQIHHLLKKAKAFKNGSLKPQKEKNSSFTVASYFEENSTRTKLSFIQACENLDARFLNFDVSTSSVKKGESLEETFFTLKSLGVNICVYRGSRSGALTSFKKRPPLKIINGGDGMHQHPTQALLDLFTMLESNHNPKNKTLTIIGDCIHSRVCHSLIDLITLWGGKVILTGPKGCVPENYKKKGVTITHNLDEALEKSDIIYLLRVQLERHRRFGESEYFSDYAGRFGMNIQKLQKLKREIPIYHAGPTNIGMEIANDIIQSKYYMGHKEVENSIFIRMAILEELMNDE